MEQKGELVSFRPDIKGVLVRDDGEITVSGFERLTDMKE